MKKLLIFNIFEFDILVIRMGQKAGNKRRLHKKLQSFERKIKRFQSSFESFFTLLILKEKLNKATK